MYPCSKAFNMGIFLISVIIILFVSSIASSAEDGYLDVDASIPTIIPNSYIFSHSPIASTITTGNLFYLNSVFLNLTNKNSEVNVKVEVYESSVNADSIIEPILVLQDQSAVALPRIMLMLPVLREIDLPKGNYLLIYR